MRKLIVLGLTLGIAGVLVFATVSGPARAGDEPCSRKKFKTELVEKACKEGGQDAAKDAMKDFVKAVKKAKEEDGDDDFKLVCTKCHSDIGGDYPLEDGAVKIFRRYKKFLDSRK